MNRRGFMQSVAAIGAAALVPTWLLPVEKRAFNLQAFCGEQLRWRNWQIDSPFTQQNAYKFLTYATDRRIVVRVNGDWQSGESNEKRPPADRLYWDHDTERGWKPWPKPQYIEKPDAICLACRGKQGDGHNDECGVCEGTGHDWSGTSGWHNHPAKCKGCNGIGVATPHCKVCHGRGLVQGPDAQVLGHALVGVEYDQLIRKECGDAEYVIIRRPQLTESLGHKGTDHDLVLFRFAAGTGILMPREEK